MIDISCLETKRKNLEIIALNLKNQFVGLSDIIDNIIKSIEVWYTFPELLTHPLIINLWGMTGVGKTDLIRKLVKELDYENKYLEIQLDSGDDNKSIQDKLIGTDITPETSAILLLDEIQRFRTVDEDNKMISTSNYSDVWELLSDGSFSDAYREQSNLQLFLFELLYNQDWMETCTIDESDNKKSKDKKIKSEKEIKRKYQQSVWRANEFKRLTGVSESIEEIMRFSNSEQIEILSKKIEHVRTKKEIKKYRKLLIFICGNMDEAYTMSSDVDDADTDADILHENSKRITSLDIKSRLLKKFKPEQIARLGNNHIIYPSLSKTSFQTLIYKKLTILKETFFNISGVNINFDESIYSSIYENGVFPAQGVRPVFSTINLLIENSLPYFLFLAIKNNSKNLKLYADMDKSTIWCAYKKDDVGESNISHRQVIFDINEIRKKTSKDLRALVAAHESGHAVAYMLLFKKVPKQLCGNSTANNSGFIIPHAIVQSKENQLKKIQVFLAGKVAEEIIFAEANSTTGSNSDLYNATVTAAEMIRSNNMDGYVGQIVSPSNPHSSTLLSCIDKTDDIIENILKQQKTEVDSLLTTHLDILKKLIRSSLEYQILTSEQLYEISKIYIPDLELLPFDKSIEPSYDKQLKKFLES